MRGHGTAGRRHERQRWVVPSGQRDALFLGVLIGHLAIHTVATRVRELALLGAHGCRQLAHLLVKNDKLLVQISSPNCAAMDLARPSVTLSVFGSAKSGFATKCARTNAASSTSIEVLCVIPLGRVMPSPDRASKISFALQRSSPASWLIRIFIFPSIH